MQLAADNLTCVRGGRTVFAGLSFAVRALANRRLKSLRAEWTAEAKRMRFGESPPAEPPPVPAAATA